MFCHLVIDNILIILIYDIKIIYYQAFLFFGLYLYFRYISYWMKVLCLVGKMLVNNLDDEFLQYLQNPNLLTKRPLLVRSHNIDLFKYCNKLTVVVLHCRNNEKITFVTTLTLIAKCQQ
jgi:hypothetical protein